MAKGKKKKRKKKKSSQTDCEISSTAKESHGTKSNHGEVPDITECICCTQRQRKKRFLSCFARREVPPKCPIHSSKDSTVIKNLQSKGKEKDTTRQPCLIRRIGRWIVKKVTKRKKVEQIPAEPLEPTTATVCVNTDEPPRLQVLCQEVLSANRPERSMQASTTTDNSAQPGSIDKTTNVNVNPETGRKMVTSLKELCIGVTDNTGSKTTYTNDSEQDLANDEAQPTEHNFDNTDVTKTDQPDKQDNNGIYNPEPDTASISSECDGGVLMTLIQLCTREVSTADDKKTTNKDDKDKNSANDADTYMKDVNLECDAKKLMSLKEICSAIVTSANISTADVIYTRTTDTKAMDINDSKEDETQLKESKDKKTKVNEDGMKPEHDQIRVMSLKDMCKKAAAVSEELEHNIDDTKAGNGKKQTKELVPESYFEQIPEIVTSRTKEAELKQDSYAEQDSGCEKAQTKEEGLLSKPKQISEPGKIRTWTGPGSPTRKPSLEAQLQILNLDAQLQKLNIDAQLQQLDLKAQLQPLKLKANQLQLKLEANLQQLNIEAQLRHLDLESQLLQLNMDAQLQLNKPKIKQEEKNTSVEKQSSINEAFISI